MKTLVTGGSGFIGSALARKLVEQGEDVRVTIRPESNTKNLDDLGVEKVYADVRDKNAIAQALKGCQRLYHTAGLYKTWLPDESTLMDINVEGTRTVLGEALRTGVGKVVFTSSIAALGITSDGTPSDENVDFNLWDTKLTYEISKYQAEMVAWDYCRQGLPVVVVRPSLVLGERDIYPTPSGKMVLDVLQGRYLLYLEGGISLVDIEDATAGHLLAMEKGRTGESYNLGNNDNNIRLKSFFSLIKEITGVWVPRFKAAYYPTLTFSYLALFVANHFTHKPPYLTPGVVQVLHRFKKMDSTKAIRELGLPQTPLRETVRRTVDWFRENGYWTTKMKGTDHRNHKKISPRR